MSNRRRYFSFETWRTLVQRWLDEVELRLLLTLALLVGGVLLFAWIADEATETGPHSFDRTLLLALREPDNLSDPIGPAWMEEAVRDFTAFGSTMPLLFLTFAITGYFLLHRNYHMAVLMLATVFGGFLLTLLLKQSFARARPDLVPRATYVYTTSFPSGHSSIAAATYLTLGALVARLQPDRRLKLYVMGVAVLLTFLVGFSRVYLGVHWPTDVLGGWVIGAVWAMVALFLSRWWLKRGQGGEEEPPTTD